MRVLFVHQNFPGQYRHLAAALAAHGHAVRAFACSPHAATLPGVELVRYPLTRRPAAPDALHPWAAETELKVLRGEACARAASRLRADGYTPDLICVHPGWGEALFLRDVWPHAPQLHFVEWYYRPRGQDVGFDPEFDPPDLDLLARLRMKNGCLLQGLADMDQGVSPTRWQRSGVPAAFRERVAVVHDGIDTDAIAPHADARFTIDTAAGPLALAPGDEVITYVSRSLEPQRGYHRLMRALPGILDRRPDARVVIVGGDGVSYSARPTEGTWQHRFLDEVRERLDPARVSFVGRLPRAALTALLQVSAVHVYLTVPFVLSWSMLEAMAAGALVVASRTPPVEEVLVDGVNGRLVDYFSTYDLEEAVCEALERPRDHLPLRRQARADAVARFDLQRVCLPAHLALAEQTAGVRRGGVG